MPPLGLSLTHSASLSIHLTLPHSQAADEPLCCASRQWTSRVQWQDWCHTRGRARQHRCTSMICLPLSLPFSAFFLPSTRSSFCHVCCSAPADYLCLVPPAFSSHRTRFTQIFESSERAVSDGWTGSFGNLGDDKPRCTIKTSDSTVLESVPIQQVDHTGS